VTTKLPRLNATTPFVVQGAGGYVLSPQAAQYLETLIVALEDAIDTVADQEQTNADTLQSLEAQQALIQQALATAGIALSTANANSNSGPKTLSATSTVGVSGSGWVSGPVVTFSSSPAASSVTFASNLPDGATVSGGTTFSGQARMVRIVSGVETVIGSPVAFTVTKQPVIPGEPGPASTVSFAGFSAGGADATTGTIAYRMDVQRASGSTTLSGQQLITSVTRAP
jgi:hypothetical protein